MAQLKQGQTVQILTSTPLEVRWGGVGYQVLNLRGILGTVRRRSHRNRLAVIRIFHPKQNWRGEVTVHRADLKLLKLVEA